MGYSSGTLSLLNRNIEGGLREWLYISTDSIATVTGASYITDATNRGVLKGDIVWVVNQTTPNLFVCQVASVAAGNLAAPGAATLAGMSADLSTGVVIGASAASTIGFYGAAVTAQPTSASEAAVSASAPLCVCGVFGFTSSQATAIITLVNQLRADLVTLGLIKGS